MPDPVDEDPYEALLSEYRAKLYNDCVREMQAHLNQGYDQSSCIDHLYNNCIRHFEANMRQHLGNSNASLPSAAYIDELYQSCARRMEEQIRQRYGRRIPRPPSASRRERGRMQVSELLEDPQRMFELCRIKTNTFISLCNDLQERQYYSVTSYTDVSIYEAVLMFLYMMTGHLRNLDIANTFGRATETTSRVTNNVAKAICRYASELIVPRNQEQVHDHILRKRRFYPMFKDCVGALDGTHIPAWVPAGDQTRFRNRHGKLTQNVLAICDFDDRFIYVYAGWEGSAHDATVLNAAISDEDLKFPFPPAGKYYLTDSAYANKYPFLAPYRANRYHLSEYRGVGANARNATELFNHTHSSLRNVVERCFGQLKKRFIFLNGPMHNFLFKHQVRFVIACAALHNYNKLHNPDDDGSDLDALLSPNDRVAINTEQDNEVEQERSDLDEADDVGMDNLRDRIACELWGSRGTR